VVLTSDLLGVAKPDPAIFAMACRRLGVAVSSAVYVRDRLQVDALAASTAGLRGIWLDRMGNGTVPAGAEAIASLAELPAALHGRNWGR
jgi:putative hydrolase of the HAD superfamily